VTREPLRKFPKGTLGYDIQTIFREESARAFEGVPTDREPTPRELKSAIGALWTATEYAFQEVVERAGNPQSRHDA
jgi:hypothetical protein